LDEKFLVEMERYFPKGFIKILFFGITSYIQDSYEIKGNWLQESSYRKTFMLCGGRLGGTAVLLK